MDTKVLKKKCIECNREFLTNFDEFKTCGCED